MLVSSSRSITEHEFNTMQAALLKQVGDYYDSDVGPKLAELDAKKTELSARRVLIEKELSDARATKAEAQEGLKLCAQKREVIEQKEQAIAQKEQAIAQKEQAIAQKEQAIAQKEQAIAQERLNALTKWFYGIFNGKKEMSAEKMAKIYQKYLSDGSLTVEFTAERKSFAQINSMKPIITYLQKHPEVKKCNFLNFKTAIKDVSTLADYLAKSSITAIGMNKNLAAESKALLSQAEAQRKGTFKVQYGGT